MFRLSLLWHSGTEGMLAYISHQSQHITYSNHYGLYLISPWLAPLLIWKREFMKMFSKKITGPFFSVTESAPLPQLCQQLNQCSNSKKESYLHLLQNGPAKEIKIVWKGKKRINVNRVEKTPLHSPRWLLKSFRFNDERMFWKYFTLFCLFHKAALSSSSFWWVFNKTM